MSIDNDYFMELLDERIENRKQQLKEKMRCAATS